MADGLIPKDTTAKSGRENQTTRRRQTQERITRTARREKPARVARTDRRERVHSFHVPYWMQWYDFVMIPICVIAAIAVILNLEAVLMFFLALTMQIMGLVFNLLLIVLIVAGIWLWWSRGRGRGRGRYW